MYREKVWFHFRIFLLKSRKHCEKTREGWSKLNAFADDKINVDHKKLFVAEKLNLFRKGRKYYGKWRKYW